MRKLVVSVRFAWFAAFVLAIGAGMLRSVPVLAFSGSGAGTSGDPYQITNCAQLNSIDAALTANYVLVNDIDCSNAASLNGGAGWKSIGSTGGGFSGVLNGQGHTVSNLDLSGFADSADHPGMFSEVINSGVVKNMLLTNSKINGGHDTGMVVGALQNNASLDNVYVQATVTCHHDNCGGLAGALEDTTLINNSGADVTVTSTDQSVGGLVGYISANGTIQKSFANGSISGTYYVGGLAGAVFGGTGTITNSYANARVTGNDRVGGLAGWGLTLNLSDSYAAGSVSGDNNIGGLVGEQTGNMANAFAAVKVTGNSAVGPVTGHFISGTVGNRYFDTHISGFSFSMDGSSAVTDSNYFKGNSTNPPFDQWDFSTLWRTNYDDYPSFAPKINPYMLCNQPSSTKTTITGNCQVAPLGWGTPTWQARWSVHNANNWHAIALANIHKASATVSGLKPGTWYDLAFRYTNDFGTGPWGRVVILTTGKATTSGGQSHANNATPSSSSSSSTASSTTSHTSQPAATGAEVIEGATSLSAKSTSTSSDTASDSPHTPTSTTDQTTPFTDQARSTTPQTAQKASIKQAMHYWYWGGILLALLLGIWLLSFVRRHWHQQ